MPSNSHAYDVFSVVIWVVPLSSTVAACANAAPVRSLPALSLGCRQSAVLMVFRLTAPLSAGLAASSRKCRSTA